MENYSGEKLAEKMTLKDCVIKCKVREIYVENVQSISMADKSPEQRGEPHL